MSFNWKWIIPLCGIIFMLASDRILTPQLQIVSELWQYRQQLEQRLRSESSLRSEIAQLETRSELLAIQLDGQLKDIPAALELSAIYRDLENIASHNNVRLKSVTPQETAKLDVHQEMGIEVIVAANFTDLVRFMYNLEGATRLFRIHGTQVKSTNDKGDVIATLYMKGMLRS